MDLKPFHHNLPSVSLLVAMRNEESYIDQCLNSIISQNYPQDRLEVFILDGKSIDSSSNIVSQIIHGKPNYHLVHNPDIIQSAAWNLGIDKSNGDIIGIISAHSELAPDYIKIATETLLRTKADMVGGLIRARNHGLVASTIALAMSTPFGVGGANFRYSENEQKTDTVFMGLCYRNTYYKIGGFDNEMIRNQDDELSYRLLKNGGHIVCNPAIRSYYYSRSTLRSLWCQYYQYGYWKVRVLQKHTRQMRSRQFVPPAFVTALLFLGVLAIPFPIARFTLFLLAGVYLTANLAASLYTAARRGWRHLFLLPLVYAILHISYGLGFLVGLVKFANRWGDKEGKVPLWTDQVRSEGVED